MITVGMNYNVLPGKDEQFVSVFSKVLRLMEEMPGHTDTQLLRNVLDDHAYVIISRWSDEAAFSSFLASDRFRNVADWGRSTVLADRPRHEIFGGDGAASEVEAASHEAVAAV